MKTLSPRIIFLAAALVFSTAMTALHADTTQPSGAVSPSVSVAPPSSPGGAAEVPVMPGIQPAPGTPQAMTDIIDIKPMETLGFDNRIVMYALYSLGILLAVALVLYLIDRFLKRRKKGKTEPEIFIPPDVRAVQMLDALEKDGTIDEREYYFRLTAIVRGYLDGRFGIDAMEMTTEELLPRINNLPLEKTLNTQLKELMKTTDPVKFAGVTSGPAKMESDLVFALSFVEKTRREADGDGNGNGE